LMCTPMCSRLSTKSLTSPPAQNARPAPVTTMQRTAESSSTSSEAWKRSRPRPRLSALNASGRLSVMVATPSWRARVRNLKSMSDLSLNDSYARLARRGPSPATCCALHSLYKLASHGGAPAPRRAAARTTSISSPRTAGPQPRDVLRLALPASLGAAAGGARHGIQDVGDLERFHENHVHALGLALLGRQLDTEAGDQDHRHRWRDLLDGLSHLPARDARH